jgi:Rrf2 family protein
MIYSRSAEYAIRAFVHLAGHESEPYIMARQIASDTGIPGHFLAKILQQLARKGMLRSSKGPTGGFALNRPASQITILEVVDAVDGLQDYQRCISGQHECSDDTACGLHDTWKPLRLGIVEYLEGTTVADAAASLEQKKRALEKGKKSTRKR